MSNPESFEIRHSPERSLSLGKVAGSLRLRLAVLVFTALALSIRNNQLPRPIEVASYVDGPDPDPLKGRDRTPRPETYMKNPFIGRDGKDYHSYKDLVEANRRWHEERFTRK